MWMLFLAAAKEENLPATVVAKVTGERRLRMVWRGDCIVDISRDFLNTNGVPQTARAWIAAPDPTQSYRDQVPEPAAGDAAARSVPGKPGAPGGVFAKGMVERFDASIGAATVLMPFAGKYQLTPEEAMVAKLPLERGETDDATVMGYGYLPGIAKFSPFHSAAYAVVESCSKLAAVGANPLAARLTFQEYFPRLRHDPQRWGQPAAALLGALSAQLGLGIPAIGGKDSMSGSFESLDVPPTLVSFAVGMTKASRTVSAAFQRTGSQVLLLPLPENGDTLLPEWKKLRAYYEAVHRMAQNGQIASASVVKEGGVAAAVARMCFGNGLGFAFDPSCRGELARAVLFAPKSGRTGDRAGRRGRAGSCA